MLQGGLFLCVLLAASAGLVIFFLTRNPDLGGGDEGGDEGGGRIPLAEQRIREYHRAKEREKELNILKAYEVIENIENVFTEKPADVHETVFTSVTSSFSTSASSEISSEISHTLELLADFSDTTVAELEVEEKTEAVTESAGDGPEEEDKDMLDDMEFSGEGVYDYSEYSGEYLYSDLNKDKEDASEEKEFSTTEGWSEGVYDYSDYNSEYLTSDVNEEEVENSGVKTFTVSVNTMRGE